MHTEQASLFSTHSLFVLCIHTDTLTVKGIVLIIKYSISFTTYVLSKDTAISLFYSFKITKIGNRSEAKFSLVTPTVA